MHIDFTSVHNVNEQAVFDRVLADAARHPGVGANAELLADVACVALNRLTPHYIRHDADRSFYQAQADILARQQALTEAVEFAFGFVQARSALGARRN